MTGDSLLAADYPPRDLKARDGARDARERAIHGVLFLAALVSILTTLGILVALTGETVAFFNEVSIFEYFGSTKWTPLFLSQSFGVWPLITATAMVSGIALLVAVPLGLISAVYLSEFAPTGVRDAIKPILEILAGIPTIVYGFFALFVVTPALQGLIPGIQAFNSLSAGLVMGVMILPMIASLSEDALTAVPVSLREGAYALGSTRFEVATRVVMPAALSGIVASIILALSRAVGETMIVAIAAGQVSTFTFDPRVAVETMTSFIVQVSLGDTPFNSIEYRTIFAVGATLFAMTFFMNMLSHWFVRRFREAYD